MAVYKFEDFAKSLGFGKKASKSEVEDARAWMRDAASEITQISGNQFMAQNKANLVNNLTMKSIGRMYMFFYDPKHKETLPYYDRFPLIFLISVDGEGFTGINLHYLSPLLRAKLMDALYALLNNVRYDETTKLKMTYRLLASSRKFRLIKPCVKRYLTVHTKSKFLQIPVTSWDTALFLPTERFVGATKQQIFRESRDIAYGR